MSLALLTGVACNQDIKKENEQLKQENAELKTERSYQDTTINEFVGAFEEVQQNLAEIRMREKSIREARAEGMENQTDAKTQIMEDIQAINELLEQNKATVATLEGKMAAQAGKLNNFGRLVRNLKEQLKEKDNQIVVLKENLASANFQMDKLNSKVGVLTEEKLAQSKELNSQKEALNTAYYAIGTSKELVKNGVIDKEGGFIGIGRTKILADDLNKEYFTKIKKSSTTSIPLSIDNKDVKVITPHPTESYNVKMDGKKPVAFEIINTTEFWKGTKYLVLVID